MTCVAEVVSELVRAGSALLEIAGLTDSQMRLIHMRPRDGYGVMLSVKRRDKRRARRRGLRQVPFRTMYYDVWRKRGLNDVQIGERWTRYIKENPGLVKGGS